MQLAWEHSDLGSVIHVSIKLCRPYNKLMKCSRVCLLQMTEVWFSEEGSVTGFKHIKLASSHSLDYSELFPFVRKCVLQYVEATKTLIILILSLFL